MAWLLLQAMAMPGVSGSLATEYTLRVCFLTPAVYTAVFVLSVLMISSLILRRSALAR
jgi:hypothetical protein